MRWAAAAPTFDIHRFYHRFHEMVKRRLELKVRITDTMYNKRGSIYIYVCISYFTMLK